MTKDGREVGRERLGLSFTIDYILFNKVPEGSSGSTQRSIDVQASPTEEKRRLHVDPSEGKTVQDEGEDPPEEVSTSDKSEEKPNQSYIALISKAILASSQKKLLLCDIYQWIMDHFPYFKSKDKNWRNSVRHNLSLNDCFVKVGRSENGKGHFWAVHPSNLKDFSKGDYHCRRARRRVRRAVGQVPLPRLVSHFQHAIARHGPAPCWCCPPAHLIPVPSVGPRLYWPWPGVQPQVRQHPDLQATVL